MSRSEGGCISINSMIQRVRVVHHKPIHRNVNFEIIKKFQFHFLFFLDSLVTFYWALHSSPTLDLSIRSFVNFSRWTGRNNWQSDAFRTVTTSTWRHCLSMDPQYVKKFYNFIFFCSLAILTFCFLIYDYSMYVQPRIIQDPKISLCIGILFENPPLNILAFLLLSLAS